MISLAALCIAVTTLLFVSLLYYRRKCENDLLPPGPPGLPLLGNLGLLSGSGLDRLRHLVKLVDTYGQNGMATLQFGPGKNNRMVFIKDHETIKRALNKDAFAGRPKTFLRDGYYQGQGIVFADGEVWSEHRRFAITTLRNFGMGKSSLQELVLAEARELVKAFKALEGKPVAPSAVILPSVCNVLCGISYGKRFSHQDGRFIQLTKLVDENLYLAAKCQPLDFFPYLRHIPFTKYNTVIQKWTNNQEQIAAFLQALIDEHKRNFRPSDDEPADYVDAFLKQQFVEKNKPDSTFTERQLLRSINPFVGAGTQATSTTLCWAIFFLLDNPDVMTRVQKEIDGVLGERLFPVLEDKERLPYCQATITEVLRLGNMVPIPGRSTVDVVEINGFILPRGTKIAPLVIAVHEDPILFPEPMKFKPERFLDQDGQFVSKVDWLLAFGSGKRLCLGEALARMEIFIFFVALARNFTIGPMQGGDVLPGHVLTQIVNCPRPFRTSFTPRS